MASFIRTTYASVTSLLNVGAALQQIVSDANIALSERTVGRKAAVLAYAATGATTTKITLPASSSVPVWGVLLVRAYPSADPSADVAVSQRVNFAQNGTTLYVYEPSGLVANTAYDLTFLVLE